MCPIVEQLIHFWYRCNHCGMSPISGIRYHFSTCPAGPYNDTGNTNEGADTYPRLLLKCMMLQKWFRTSYDPNCA